MSSYLKCPICKNTDVEMIIDAQVRGRIVLINKHMNFKPRMDGIRLFDEDRSAFCSGCAWEICTTGDMIPAMYTPEQVEQLDKLRTTLEERALI